MMEFIITMYVISIVGGTILKIAGVA